MSRTFKGWKNVEKHLGSEAAQQRKRPENERRLLLGQCDSLDAIGDRLPRNGVLLADEVGMGKTRIAVTVARAVVAAGGRVAILVPPGLGFQWLDELRGGGLEAPAVLRSLTGFLDAYSPPDDRAATPWPVEPIVLISHAFTNWRLSHASDAWRWALLPELFAAWHRHRNGKLPKGYAHAKANCLTDSRVRIAAARIVAGAAEAGLEPRLDELLNALRWDEMLAPGNYAQSTTCRLWLERSIGLALGEFDLVIVDEAHKARGDESGLSRLLNHLVLVGHDARRLGMTATPVELNVEQWLQTLTRLGLEPKTTEKLSEPIRAYSEAIRLLRSTWRTSQDARRNYKRSAEAFQSALSPYLLRRDKREDLDVVRFAAASGLPYHAYRSSTVVPIQPDTLSPEWREAVCAAEALAVVVRHADDPVAKRLRLTFGNGHGVGNVVDASFPDAKRDVKQLAIDKTVQRAAGTGLAVRAHDKQRLARAKFWNAMIRRATPDDPESLLSHPAIEAAVRTIESDVASGEKVLVFGRFTKPMQALVELLNARALVRHLREGRPWPQQKVHKDSVRVMKFALEQLGATESLAEINRKLGDGYKLIENRRRTFRDRLVRTLDKSVNAKEHGVRARGVIDLLKANRKAGTDESAGLTLLSRALLELHQTENRPDGAWIANEFAELISAVSDHDSMTESDDDEANAASGEILWQSLSRHLESEYDSVQAGFAKLMHGETKPEARRLMQLAFNRPESTLRVLVAQSMVGREGLNLHESCRVVLLLHHEWNPGVAEQQIGRVDRLKSQWANDLDRVLKRGQPVDANDLPRIEVRHIVFQGTYDEHNWDVLRERWDDLRAQLHGEVVPVRATTDLTNEQRLILEDLSKSAPNFSPTRARSIDAAPRRTTPRGK